MEPIKKPYINNKSVFISIIFQNLKIFTFLSASCKPGANVMQAAIVPSINNNAYIIRVLVLLRHVGH